MIRDGNIDVLLKNVDIEVVINFLQHKDKNVVSMFLSHFTKEEQELYHSSNMKQYTKEECLQAEKTVNKTMNIIVNNLQ